jgi:hypothetical protein
VAIVQLLAANERFQYSNLTVQHAAWEKSVKILNLLARNLIKRKIDRLKTVITVNAFIK